MVLLLAGGLASAAWAAGVTGAPAPAVRAAAANERAAIDAQRLAIEQDFDRQEAACRRQFVVTACVDDVRRRRRVALAPLRARVVQVDEAARQARAAERRQAIADKQAAGARRAPFAGDAESASAPGASPAATVPRPAPALRSAPAVGAASSAAADARQGAREDAAARVQAAQRRQQQAQAAQVRIERRLQQQKLQGQRAAPLPVPAAGSSPTR